MYNGLPVYDVFLFFNELELLELRCEELKGLVDKHYLIESPSTFQGKDKPLYYAQNESLFQKYPIEHVVIELPNKGAGLHHEKIWENESKARDLGFGEATKNMTGDDILFISDADEIPRKQLVMQEFHEPRASIAICMMQFCYYWLDFRYDEEVWAGTIRTPAWRVKEHGGNATFMQRKNYGNLYQIWNGGWHFSYQGGVEKIQDKLKAFSHSEFNTPGYLNEDHLKDKLETGRDLFGRGKEFRKVSLDGYPQYLLDNLDKYQHMLYHKL